MLNNKIMTQVKLYCIDKSTCRALNENIYMYVCMCLFIDLHIYVFVCL